MNDREGNIVIAKNTLIVYVRVFVTIVVGLVTSRLTLQALGVDDFGLYNLVGSVVTLFSFISGSLSGTTQRFLNFEMGKPDGDAGRMFNICNVLHIWCALILLAVIEIVGMVYILNFMKVIPGKEADAMFVFQISTLVACIGIVNIPYQSLFAAHEKFGIPAAIDIFNTLVKLLAVILLFKWKGNALRFYAVAMSLTTLISFVAYHALSRRFWPGTVKWNRVRGWENYREALHFNNYNLLSSGVLLLRSQGSNMLMNFFFGTATNGAFAIASQMLNYINKFVGNFDFASAPQITRSLSAGDSRRSAYLTERVCRLSVVLMLVIFFTANADLGLLLDIWLKEVPEGALILCRYTLLIGLVSSTSGGLVQLINAYGKVKWFRLQFVFLYVAALLLGWLAFRNGAPAFTILLYFAIADALSRVNQLILLRTVCGFDSWTFARRAYARPLVMAAVIFVWLAVYRWISPSSPWARFLGVAATAAVSLAAAYFIGLLKSERERINEIVTRKVKGTLQKLMLRFFYPQALKRKWKNELGTELDLAHPRDINEKINWLMCYGDTSRWARCADKLGVRDFLAEKGYPDLRIPVLGTWRKAEDIDYDSLPEKFVLKCNHDSGSWHVIDKKAGYDREAINKDLNKHLKQKFGYVNGEMFYNSIEPCILAEPYLENPVDYKLWCFDGRPYMFWVGSNRTHEEVDVCAYDLDWNPHPEKAIYNEHKHQGDKPLPRPASLERMIETGAALSEGFPEVRVDFYEIDGKLLLGEMTFAMQGGRINFYTPEFLRELGDQCKLPTDGK